MKSRTVRIAVNIDDFETLVIGRTTTTNFCFTYDPTRPAGIERRDRELSDMHEQIKRLLEATE